MKLIYLEWEDAFTQGDGWMSADMLDDWKNETFVVKQSGWVYDETDRHIILVGGFNAGVHDAHAETYKQCIKIPKSWISKRVDLTEYIKEKNENNN